jgi:hypothetical protein
MFCTDYASFQFSNLVLFFFIIEYAGSWKITKEENRMANTHKGKEYTEEATIPGLTFNKKVQLHLIHEWVGLMVLFLFQLCYVDPGIASEEEMEKLKTIDSVFLEL